jgi:hypothetical protein
MGCADCNLKHFMMNPNTLLSRYYGLHRVKLAGGRKIHFVVMGNVLPPNKDVHEVFDLKVRPRLCFYSLRQGITGWT